MRRLAFFDTNIFLYSDDTAAAEKKATAIQLITEYHRLGLAVVSLQVLQEYFAAATRKLGVDPALAQRKVEWMTKLRIIRFSESDIIASIELHRLYRTSFWDAMILQAAKLSGAQLLFSEDLQHRSTIGGVTIVNPFVAP